jgi:cytidylate kinase
MKRLLITIDGPAGAGKTTVSRELARRLGYTYVDTGALYRAVALAAIRDTRALEDEKRLAELCDSLALQFTETETGLRLFMDGEDISDHLRTQQITMLASALSARPAVRRFLLDIQRDMGRNGGAVFEGRDMGTVVFPNADIKFFLYADPDVRALRRYREVSAKGIKISLSEISETMKRRDEEDSTRDLAPLRPAEDAVQVDSTSMGIDEVVETMFRRIAEVLR